MKLEHVLSTSQFLDKRTLEELFNRGDELKKQRTADSLNGKILASVFYEPSTRTRFSFEAAMHRLGGEVISTENAESFSSAVKGETLEDSIRVISSYADAIVLRHHEKGACKRAASVSSVPVINAGDGPGEHPTQALLDLYTLQ
ncbi:aspartate carbamoyltransferase, partial [Candidatus Micrarchaeota archaeon]|nr:aspartate carbamoyltransferase [Candidatus Micrarchaeota archaeon]